VRLLQQQYPEQWSGIMDAMTRIMPGLSRIEVTYTPTRELGLYFHESGTKRPWSVSEISDGTIQTLALLVAILDPRPTFLVVEEPENSVHPWIIRNVLDACAKDPLKQTLITTHSPVVLNSVDPRQVMVMWRSQGESRLARLVDLDKDFLSLWESGTVGLYDFLDSGALAEALPPSANGEQDEFVDSDRETDISKPNVELLTAASTGEDESADAASPQDAS
jgi:predicted ATPase